MTQTHFRPSQLSLKILFSALLIVLADILFYASPIAWSLGLFEIALLFATTHFFIPRPQTLLHKIFFGCALIIAISSYYSVSSLRILLFNFSLAALIVLNKRGEIRDGLVLLLDVMHLAVNIVLQWARDLSVLRYLRKKQTQPLIKTTPNILRLLWLTLLPLLLSAIFILLFSRTNPLWAKIMPELNIARFIGAIGNLFSFSRLWFWFGTAITVWALFRRKFWLYSPKTSQQVRLDRLISSTSIIVSLAIFNVIFVLQNWFDVSFLLSNQDLPKGMTYAQYAQAGAYPLIITALLAAAYVLLVFSESHKDFRTRLSEGLVYFWIVQNILLVSSAIIRTLNYVSVYMLTHWRIAALIWMGLVAVGLFLILIRIWKNKSNVWLINCNLITLFCILFLCSFFNFSRLIADYNVAHHPQGRMLDMRHMMALGYDSLPALYQYYNLLEDEGQKKQVLLTIELLQRQLTSKLSTGWRSWTKRDSLLLEEISLIAPSIDLKLLRAY